MSVYLVRILEVEVVVCSSWYTRICSLARYSGSQRWRIEVGNWVRNSTIISGFFMKLAFISKGSNVCLARH